MLEKLRPLKDCVLIKRLGQEEKTAGGLYIPDVAKEKTQTGEVVAVGSGRVLNDGKIIPMQVKVGDVVFFGKYAGIEANNDFIVIREDEIFGVIEK